MDLTNLQALLFTPIQCILTLVDVLKVKESLWKDMLSFLKKMGEEVLKSKDDLNKVQ